MSNFCRIAILLISFLPISAMAQWETTVTTDSFSDESVIIVKNEGTVLEGTKGSTSLIFRIKDGKQEMYWVTPDSYICDFGTKIKARYGTDEPSVIYVTPSTSKDTLFFITAYAELFRATTSNKIRLLLEDRCGARTVAQFDGNIKLQFPKIARFEKLPSWAISNGGFVELLKGKIVFKYRPHGYDVDFVGNNLKISEKSEFHDFEFNIKESNLIGKDVVKIRKKIKLNVGGTTFDGKVFFITEKIAGKTVSTGNASVSLNDKSDKDEFIKMLLSNPIVHFSINEISYSIQISDFDAAIRIFEPTL